MAEHNDIGKNGESAALKYLIEKGYLIRDVNWRFGSYEVDIIAENKDFIIFIEVKTRSSNNIVEPELSVNKTKQKNIIKAANNYINFKKIQKEARFDIITILISSEQQVIKHIEDAFYPTLK